MVLTPEAMAARYVEAGCSRLIVHVEACPDLRKTLETINSLGANAAVALNPETPASAVSNVLDLVDMVLVMTVRPGFGGQKFIPMTLEKLRQARQIIDASGRDIRLEVDGGVGPANIREIAEAGADMFVAGSAIFGQPDYKTVIDQMRAELAKVGATEV